MPTTSHNDKSLNQIIEDLKSAIQAWAEGHELWFDCGFKTYAEHVDGEPDSPPVVLIVYFSSQFGDAIDGAFDGLDTQFIDLLEQHGFWYERWDGVTIHVYPTDENPLLPAFADLVRWQWICGLLQPDVDDVYEEIYSHFANRPEDLHRLEWREFETLLFRVFQNQGFQAELGPGSGDGGVDIRLLQRDPIGDMLTLVQAKKYAPHRKIGLEAVAALHGVAAVENASQSIFVTTSAYLPSAKAFAGRTSGALDLRASDDVVRWCRDATDGLIRDKSSLVAIEQVSSLLQNLAQRDARVVHANTGVTMILNGFALVLKETKHAALLMTLPRRVLSDDGYGQQGFEVPVLDQESLNMLTPENVFRAKRSVYNGRVGYWTGQHLFGPWDWEPASFSFLD